MSRIVFNELISFLIQPGGVSKPAWDDTYKALCYVDVNTDIFLYHVISVLSRVARARKNILPDSLHNLMILNSPVPSDDWATIARNKSNDKYIKSYLKMVANLSKK